MAKRRTYKLTFAVIIMVAVATISLKIKLGGQANKQAVHKIYLLLSEGVDEKFCAKLLPELSSRFKVPCEIYKRRLQLPKEAYNVNRRQYESSFILKRLHILIPQYQPPDNSKQSQPIERLKDKKILSIVDVDLYAKGLNFVFGEAELCGSFAIISLTRLRQEFYGLKPDEKLFFERTLKEAVHELGHTYGLGHCKKPACVMYFSNSLLDTDRKSTNFCNNCQKKVTEATATITAN